MYRSALRLRAARRLASSATTGLRAQRSLTTTTTAPTSSDPDPWDVTAKTMRAFWDRYGRYVRAYLAWSILGSLALNVQWTRQEREELEEQYGVTLRKLRRELAALEEAKVAAAAAAVKAEASVPVAVPVGEASATASSSWFGWLWGSSPTPAPVPEPIAAVEVPVEPPVVQVAASPVAVPVEEEKSAAPAPEQTFEAAVAPPAPRRARNITMF
ncbi:hypothetical protein H9P43_000401 [Blastocladiella emersonii ATCC 22665]|nr:hypothetical protein H9P43_000401 [Blastocladiella emersonii ATCC 22665]